MLLLKATVVCLLITCALGFTSDYNKPSKYDKNKLKTYSFHQIYKLLKRSLSCLEKFESLNPGAVNAVVSALATINEVFITIPNVPPEIAELIRQIEARLDKIVDREIENHSEDPLSSVWNIQIHGKTEDNTFRPGRVPKYFPLNKSFQELIDDFGRNRDKANQCIADLFDENGIHDGPRNCVTNCGDDMINMDYYTDIPPFQKVQYLGFMVVLNCSNLLPKTYQDYVVHLCSYCKREVDTILLYQSDPNFHNYQDDLLRRVAICGVWGIPELITEKILIAILKLIDCHGCAKFYNNPEEQQLYTAEIVSILSSALRWTVQINSN